MDKRIEELEREIERLKSPIQTLKYDMKIGELKGYKDGSLNTLQKVLNNLKADKKIKEFYNFQTYLEEEIEQLKQKLKEQEWKH